MFGYFVQYCSIYKSSNNNLLKNVYLDCKNKYNNLLDMGGLNSIIVTFKDQTTSLKPSGE